MAHENGDPDAEDPLDLLIDDYLSQVRSGGQPASLDEYAAAHPEFEADLRRYLPVLAVLEEAGNPMRTHQLGAEDETRVETPERTETDIPETLGRYTIDRMIGKGGMGTVYLAHDTQLDRRVALKIPRFDQPGPESVQRFQREARSMATVEHPNLCPIYDVGQVDGQDFLTMGFIDGQSLTEVLDGGQTLPQQDTAALIQKLALASAAIHDAGIVHRDIKPGNIMITDDGHPVLMDFGLARRENEMEPELTQAGAIVGSPAYMSPEQMEPEVGEVGPQSDVYSLGVVLFEALCGRRPFTGSATRILRQVVSEDPPPLRTFRSDVSPQLEAICLKALSRRPDGRYATATEFAEALRQFATGKDSVRASGSWLKYGAAAMLPILLLAAFAVIRLKTPHGEIVVEVPEGMEVSVEVTNNVTVHENQLGLAG